MFFCLFSAYIDKMTMSTDIRTEDDACIISRTNLPHQSDCLNSDSSEYTSTIVSCSDSFSSKQTTIADNWTYGTRNYEETESGFSSTTAEAMKDKNTHFDGMIYAEKVSRSSYVWVEDIYRKDEDGDTLLHTALIIQDPELALYFIQMTPCFSWLNIKNKISQTPLHLAVLTNQVSLVRRLVIGGADLQSRDKDGNTPIHLACRGNLLNVVKALLEPVCEEDMKQNNYEIPPEAMVYNLDIKNYDGLACLHLAALKGHIDMIKTLLHYGADVNAWAGKSGKTILHEAAWTGNIHVVKFLVSLGRQCDINARTYDDSTPFDLARSRGHWSIVMELATAGAKYEAENGVE